ncbi:ATP-binding protein [Pseudonocardia sp.]|uniref:ATP-binding protein n=1 Tax=Pseudonocardia sp. TaxID=60912 RepID=UPI00262D16DF|nr:ATP-binding protein [Pseudonocardia sp.]
MKVGALRAGPRPPEGPAPFQHAAGFHASPTHLLGQLVPLARGALDRGDRVALALAPDTADALRHAVDGDLVDLAPPAEIDGGSGQTVALRRARELRTLTATGPVTVLAEHLPDLDGPDGGFWTELDAAVNVTLAELPVHLTCFFPEMPLHQAVLDGARGNHPQLLVDGRLLHNPEHRPPRAVLAGHPAASPALLGAPDLRLPFHSWQLQDVRRAVRALAGAAGFTEDRTEDVVLAVNEIATNAVEHGTGDPGAVEDVAVPRTGSAPRPAELHVWATPAGLTCEVHDGGTLRDPLPGLHAPHPSDPRGRGLWIARQICDLLHVWADAEGTHVRVRAAP